MMQRTTITIIIVVIAAGVGFFVWQFFSQRDIPIPKGTTTSETLVIQDGQVVSTADEVATTEQETETDQTLTEEERQAIKERVQSLSTKEIMVTNGTRHSIPLDDIIGGGPPKDGIPSIDKPKFISVEATGNFLSDDDIGLAVEIDGVARFYPFKIMVWHEIVNDTINGRRILVSYCPLCLSGIVFDPLVQGERVEFGVSGKLWNSNLLMYDRKTDSLWSQVLGEAVLGEMTGTALAVLPSDQTKYGAWKQKYPNGQVLSRDTGAVRIYGSDPYGDYYFTPGVFFPIDNRDNRLAEKDFILGIVINGQAKAYLPEAIKRAGKVEEIFAGKTIVATYEPELDVVRIYEKQTDGSLTRINPFTSFWFSWVAVHPKTELYK